MISAFQLKFKTGTGRYRTTQGKKIKMSNHNLQSSHLGHWIMKKKEEVNQSKLVSLHESPLRHQLVT